MKTIPFGSRALGIGLAVALLAGCGGAQIAPNAATPSVQAKQIKSGTSRCPCLYVANQFGSYTGNITVYASGASGDAVPIQNIAGSKTGLDTPEGVAVDDSGNMYVANEVNNSVTVYAAGSTGNVAPVQTIMGSNTGLGIPFGIAIGPTDGNIYVANIRGTNQLGSITVYPPNANGNWPPSATITGEYSQLRGPRSVYLDAEGNIYSTGDKTYTGGGQAILEYSAGSTSDALPIRIIYNHGKGKQKDIDFPWGLTLDSANNIYLNNYVGTPYKSTVSVYSSKAKGGVYPIRRITGTKTGLNLTGGIAVDTDGNIFVSGNDDPSDGSYKISVFKPGTKKDKGPRYTIAGPDTGLSGPAGIVIR
jgi:hypothetical protein